MYLIDTLSCAPRKTTEQHNDKAMTYSHVILSSRLNELRRHTGSDPTLQQLHTAISKVWPRKQTQLPPEICQYFPYRDELTVKNGVIMKGLKTVISKSLQNEYITIVHRGHPGNESTKQRARDIMFFLAFND